jgi:glycosyltransferase involved in cell wall biosynthesis
MVTPSFLPYIGGQEVYVQALSQALVDRGHQVTVVTTDTFSRAPFRRVSGGRENESKIRVVRYSCYGFLYSYLPIAPSLLSALLNESIRQYQIVHAHGFGHFTSDIVSLMRRMYGIPAVLTTHGLHQESGQEALHKSLLWYCYRETLVRFTLRTVDRILVLTPDEIRYLSRFGTRIVNKTRVVPIGVRLQDFSPVSNLRTQQRPMILYVGRIDRGKGLEFLIQAASQLREYDPLVLLVGARTSYSGVLEKLVAETGLASNVLLTGLVTEGEKQGLLMNATIVCIPSKYEGASLAVLEAMAAGKPVVASKVGGIPFLVEDGSSGYLVKPNDTDSLAAHLKQLILHPGIRDNMGKRGREIARKYSWSQIAKRMEEIYLELTS